jgi:uncharacterized protein YbjQ (UPF0145 family)
MFVSGLSGNEIYCLSLKGFTPGELTVGNCVNSMGLGGSLRSMGRSFAGGEIQALTNQISEGRHAAITRLENEAKRHGAVGVTGVEAHLRSLAGYTEFLAQGTAVHSQNQIPFFSTAASGIQLYCHLDAGYRPVKFAMGNIAYALGFSRGLTGGLRTMKQGEVKEFSQMYNEIRHTALARLKAEAAGVGANAVVDVDVRVIRHGAAVELLLTGTACHHAKLGKPAADQVVTSELTGEELWNLAKLGSAPRQLVMATSVYSLGIAAGIGTAFRAMAKGELPEVTQLVYAARENCIDLLRREAKELGASQVIGNRLAIFELQPGLIEIFCVGTAVTLSPDMAPESPALIPQAVITEKEGFAITPVGFAAGPGERRQVNMPPACGCIIAIVFFLIFAGGMIASIVASASRAGRPARQQQEENERPR